MALAYLPGRQLKLRFVSSFNAIFKKLMFSFWSMSIKFGQRTSIHGLNHFLAISAHKYERCIWLLVLICCGWGYIYVGSKLSLNFNGRNLETIIDTTRDPVYRIYFPTVTICNRNRLNWNRIEEAKLRFMHGEGSTEKLALFERIVGTFDDVAFANFDKFAVLEREPLHLLEHVNFSLVVDFMSWKCDELLDNCVWNFTPIPCCELFTKRKSKNGICWAFNTLENEEGRARQQKDGKYPWHLGDCQAGTGLLARVLIHPEKHYPKRINQKGISLMLAEPNIWHTEPFIVPANTTALVEIEPTKYFYDAATQRISSSVRKCVFADERNSRDFKTLPGYVYMFQNCEAQCHQEYMMRYCNCTIDLLFPPGPFPACNITNLLCLARNNDRFLYSKQKDEEVHVRNDFEGMSCHCLHNCFDLHYMTNVQASPLTAAVRGNLSYIDLNLYYRFDTIVAYRTRLIYGWLDLLVAFGGIAGLFLGCSLISFVEVLHLITIELPWTVYEVVKKHRTQTKRGAIWSTTQGI